MIEEPLFKIKPVFVPMLWLVRILPYHIGLSLLLAGIMMAGYLEVRTTMLMRHRIELLPLYIAWLCMVTLMPMLFLKIREHLFFVTLIEVFKEKLIFRFRKNNYTVISLNADTTITVSVSKMQRRYGCGTVSVSYNSGKTLRLYDIIGADYVKKQIEECIHG